MPPAPSPQIVDELDLRHWLKPDSDRPPLDLRMGYYLRQVTTTWSFHPLIFVENPEDRQGEIILTLSKRVLGLAYAAVRRTKAEIISIPIAFDATRNIAWDISALGERLNMAAIETRPGEYPVLPMQVYDEARLLATMQRIEASERDEHAVLVAPRGIRWSGLLIGGSDHFQDPDFTDSPA